MSLPSEKRENIERDVASRVRDGRYRLTNHFRSRAFRRQVVLPEVEQVLRSGLHAPEDDLLIITVIEIEEPLP